MSSAALPDGRTRLLRGLCCLAVASAFLVLPAPAALEPAGWRLLGIFAAVILAFVLQPVGMGPAVLLGLFTATLTKSLPLDPEKLTSAEATKVALSGYGEKVVWLVVGAFLIAGAVQGSGLGRRIALGLVVRLGRTTLGLGYALSMAELVLGPVVPSNTARGGGILAPIGQSLADALGSRPDHEPRRAGAYLALVGAHANLIAAAMFLTGMAANPLVAQAAEDVYDVEFGWGRWALGALVPGLVAMALLPLFLHKLVPPDLRDASAAREHARGELSAMGAWSMAQKVTLGVFVLLLLLWASKPLTGLDTTLVAWLGVVALFLTGARSWDEMVRDPRAWDVLVWLGGLLTMANGLKDLGVVDWFVEGAQGWVDGYGALPTVLFLALAYFFSMYGFSMLTAHISAMVGAFLAVCLAADVPPLLAVPLFAYFSDLCACTTNYSTGPMIIWYGLGYVPARTWLRVGFLVALFQLAIWIPLGLLWWKVLGWW